MKYRQRRINKFLKNEDADPLSVVVNLFDVAMVFAVALMVAMVMHINMTEIFTQEDYTIVKNPGKDNMEIITKEGNKINRYIPFGRTIFDSAKRKKNRYCVRIGKRGNYLCPGVRVSHFNSLWHGGRLNVENIHT